MGYIAPINMEQANQYHLRTIQNEDHPITWERVYRVKLHQRLAKHQELDEVYRRKEQFKKQTEQKREGNKNGSVIVSEQAKVGKRQDVNFPEITGKGKFISDSV